MVHYSGLSVSATLSDLRPYDVYVFTVRSCTAAGCLRSEPVTVETKSALPTGQGPPAVEAQSATALEVSWSPPANPNGVCVCVWFLCGLV